MIVSSEYIELHANKHQVVANGVYGYECEVVVSQLKQWSEDLLMCLRLPNSGLNRPYDGQQIRLDHMKHIPYYGPAQHQFRVYTTRNMTMMRINFRVVQITEFSTSPDAAYVAVIPSGTIVYCAVSSSHSCINVSSLLNDSAVQYDINDSIEPSCTGIYRYPM